MENCIAALPRSSRPRRRLSRPAQIALKTTPEKIQQLDRLSVRTGKLKIDVIEEALDLYEAKLDDDDRRKAEEN